MLTETEISGLRDILSYLNEEDIFSILNTVTKGMLKAHNRNEAIEVILSSTEKPSDLLRRQKLSKKTLFKYLIEIGVKVSADAGKATFVKLCLERWSSGEIYKESDYNDSEVEEVQLNNDYTIVQMGIEFSKWFFSIYNTLNSFGPEHFWPDCNLWAMLKSVSELKEVKLHQANDVVAFLANLIVVDKFYFHANQSKDAIVCQPEQHGLVKILIRGVVHQHSNCIGLFDFAFGLVRNPAFQNNWKIKLIKIEIQINTNTNNGISLNYVPNLCQTVS